MDPSKINKIIKIVALLAILVAALMLGGTIFGISTYLSFFPKISAQVTSLGINPWLAKIIAIPVLIALGFAIKKIFFGAFGNKGKRVIGYTIIISIFSLFCLGMYYKDTNKPKMVRLRPTENMAFFNEDGQPIVWYAKTPNGTIEIFSQPGRHLQYGVNLEPVSPEIAAEILDSIHKEAGKLNQAKLETAKPAEPTPTPEPIAKAELTKESVIKPEIRKEVAPRPVPTQKNASPQKRIVVPAIAPVSPLTPVKAVIQDSNGNMIAESEKKVALRELVIVLENK